MKKRVMGLIILAGFNHTLYGDESKIKKTFAPENNLFLEDNPNIIANITEPLFNQITFSVINLYHAATYKLGARLTSKLHWKSPVVNAYAQRPKPNIWEVDMFGGLARRPEVTPDGFALVVCHEVGHHLAGFPTYEGSEPWASVEGNSDYFAVQACAKKLWGNDTANNANARNTVTPYAKSQCDQTYPLSEPDQNLCYRIAMAGQSLGNLLAAIGGEKAPNFQTPDQYVAPQTISEHPNAQCRLDTYLQGNLCVKFGRMGFIPGVGSPSGPLSVSAEHEAAANSCFASDGYMVGGRPLCWFKPRL